MMKKMCSRFLLAICMGLLICILDAGQKPILIEAKEKAESIQITECKDLMEQGNTFRFRCKCRKKGRIISKIWTSSNEDVLMIDKKTGKAKAVSPGQTTVTVTLCMKKEGKGRVELTDSMDVSVMPSKKQLKKANRIVHMIPMASVSMTQTYQQMDVVLKYQYSYYQGDYQITQEAVLNKESVHRYILRNRRAYEYYYGDYSIYCYLGEEYDNTYQGLWSFYNPGEHQAYVGFEDKGAYYEITSVEALEDLPAGTAASYESYGTGGYLEYVEYVQESNLWLNKEIVTYVSEDGKRTPIYEKEYVYGLETPKYDVLEKILIGNEEKKRVSIVMDPGTQEETTYEIAVTQMTKILVYYGKEYLIYKDKEGKIPWEGSISDGEAHLLYFIRTKESDS